MTSLGGEDQRDDEPVQRECLSENQNENHAHEYFVLLSVCPHTSVAHNTNGQPGGLHKQKTTNELNPQHSPEAKCAYPDLSE